MAITNHKPKATHENCGGEIEYIALKDKVEIKVICKKCGESWEVVE